MILPVLIRRGVWLGITALLVATLADTASVGGAFATSTSVSLKSLSRDIGARSASARPNRVRSRKLKREITGANRLGLLARNIACVPQLFGHGEPTQGASCAQFLYGH